MGLWMGDEGLWVAGGGVQVRTMVPALPKAGRVLGDSAARCLPAPEPGSAPEPISQDGPWWDDAGRVEPVEPVSPLQARQDFSTAFIWVINGWLKSSRDGCQEGRSLDRELG